MQEFWLHRASQPCYLYSQPHAEGAARTMNHQPRIFISSVQKELAAERRALADFINGDPLLQRYFDLFLFEDLPATDRRADDVYLDEDTPIARTLAHLNLLEYGYRKRSKTHPLLPDLQRHHL